MNDAIQLTIKSYFSEFENVPTSEIYQTYLDLCVSLEVKPENRITVIRKICALTGHKSKKKCITVLTKG